MSQSSSSTHNTLYRGFRVATTIEHDGKVVIASLDVIGGDSAPFLRVTQTVTAATLTTEQVQEIAFAVAVRWIDSVLPPNTRHTDTA